MKASRKSSRSIRSLAINWTEQNWEPRVKIRRQRARPGCGLDRLLLAQALWRAGAKRLDRPMKSSLSTPRLEPRRPRRVIVHRLVRLAAAPRLHSPIGGPNFARQPVFYCPDPIQNRIVMPARRPFWLPRSIFVV